MAGKSDLIKKIAGKIPYKVAAKDGELALKSKVAKASGDFRNFDTIEMMDPEMVPHLEKLGANNPFYIQHLEADKGYGKKALDTIEASAKKRGADAAYLNASPVGGTRGLSQEDAAAKVRKFYEKNGYQAATDRPATNTMMYKKLAARGAVIGGGGADLTGPQSSDGDDDFKVSAADWNQSVLAQPDESWGVADYVNYVLGHNKNLPDDINQQGVREKAEELGTAGFSGAINKVGKGVTKAAGNVGTADVVRGGLKSMLSPREAANAKMAAEMQQAAAARVAKEAEKQALREQVRQQAKREGLVNPMDISRRMNELSAQRLEATKAAIPEVQQGLAATASQEARQSVLNDIKALTDKKQADVVEQQNLKQLVQAQLKPGSGL